MTSPSGGEIATTWVSVLGDASKLDDSIKTAVKKGQAYADAHPIEIDAKVDTNSITRAAKSVKIPAVLDTSAIDRGLQNAGRGSGTVSFAAELDTASARTTMTAFRKSMAAPISIPVHLDIASATSTAAASAAISEAIQASPDMTAVVDQIEAQMAQIDFSGLADRLREQIGPVFADIGGPIDVDVATADAALTTLTRDRRIHIGVDVDWIPLITASAALINLNRLVEIQLGLSMSDLIQVDATIANLVRPRNAQINVEVDQTTAATAETRLDTIARNRRVELNVDSAALAGLTALGSHTVKLDVEVKQDSLTAANAVLDFLARDRTVSFHADVDAASARLADALLDHIGRRRTATFAAALDASAAARMEILMRLLARDRNVRFNAENLGGISGQADSANRSLTAMSLVKMTGLVAGIAAITPVLLGVAGAAGGAIGALAIGFAALGPAALAAAGTVTVALSGIKDAFSALSAAEDSAASDGEAQAKAVAAAQEQVKTALEGVADAQDSLTDAQKDAKDAADDVADAYKDAREQLEDYVFTVKDAALSEAEAKQALIDARTEFAKAPPEDRAKAFLRLQRADLRYQQAVEKNKDTRQEANEAFAKGVEGSDAVVAAKERSAEADKKVVEAQAAVIKAQENVAKAQKAVTEAMNSGSSAQDKAARALAELSPNAQAFVLATRDIKSSWDELVKNPAQDALFAGAAEGIKELATAALPTLGAGMTDVAGSLNGLTHQFAEFWKAPENLEGVRSIFAGTADFIDGLGPGLQQATQGFLSLGQAFEPVANQVGAQFGGMLGQIGQAFTDAFQSGALTQLFSTFGNILQGLGGGLNSLIDGLITMGNIVGPTLGPLFQSIGDAVKSAAPALGQLGATFATTLTQLMPSLSGFISALATGLGPVLPVIGDLLGSLMGALTPMIGPLSQMTQVIGNALVQAITALQPAMGPLSQAWAALATAIVPILPMFAELVSSLIQALAPAMVEIFNALGPVITQFGDAFMPIIEDMAPVLAEVAKTLGQAIAKALTDLAPILPPLIEAWGEMLLAITPILPEMAKLASEILPPLTQLLIEMSPVILKLMEALTGLINNVVIPLVIPMMEKFGGTVKWALETATSVVSGAKDKLKGAMEDISGFFTGAGETIGKAWDLIVRGIARSVNAIGELLKQVPALVPGGKAANALGNSLVEWATPRMATGGLLRGPGTGTSDSILAAVSNGEYIVNAKSTARTLPLLEAINAGWVPSAAYLHGMIPGFAEGGRVPGKAFAQSMDSATYLMGGYNKKQIDCSGLVAAVVNDALGLDPWSGRMSTVNEGSWLKAKGAKPGLGGPGDIAIAWYDRGGGANGHTAMRLGDGTGVESRSGDGVVIGSSATPVTSSMFDQAMHLPKELLMGGDLGGPASGTGAQSGGSMGVLGTSLGGGTGGSGGTSSGGSGGSSTGTGPSYTNGAVNVFVTNGAALSSTLGSASTGTASPVTSSPTDGLTAESLTQGIGVTPPTAPTDVVQSFLGGLNGTAPVADQGTHPLANVPGLTDLANGPAPWYMAASPEQAAANLGTQAASLAQRGVSDVTSFFQDNWREMLETGAGVLGMGAVAAKGSGDTYNFNGMDPHSSAAAVDRVRRRKVMATARSGGVR